MITYYSLGSSGGTLGEAPLSLELFKTRLDKLMVDQVTAGSTSRGRLAHMILLIPIATSSDPVSQKNLKVWLGHPGPSYSAWEDFWASGSKTVEYNSWCHGPNVHAICISGDFTLDWVQLPQTFGVHQVRSWNYFPGFHPKGNELMHTKTAL